MRVWHKNFLYTLSLFTVLFFICIFIVDALSFSSALQSERETAMREETLLAQSLQQNISDIETRDNYPAGISSKTASYGASYQKKGIYLILKTGETELYSNSPFAVKPADTGSKNRVCKLLNFQETEFICIYDTLFSSRSGSYSFVYIKDINSLYETVSGQSFILIFVGAAVSVMFAFLLYFTLKKIYGPVDNLAHELRTPLTAIRGYAEYLQSAAADEEERYSAANYIIEESNRLSGICDRLLILANLREGDIAFEEVDIRKLFDNAKMTYKSVEYEIMNRFIKGDKALLQSMINNLVSNAVKASPPGEAVRLSSYDNVIEVADNGRGMSADVLARVSKAGSQLQITGRSEGGSGLGIPLCRQIARLHNAKISFESAEGKGTTVRVTFTSS